jgi:hypothetical protein
LTEGGFGHVAFEERDGVGWGGDHGRFEGDEHETGLLEAGSDDFWFHGYLLSDENWFSWINPIGGHGERLAGDGVVRPPFRVVLMFRGCSERGEQDHHGRDDYFVHTVEIRTEGPRIQVSS